MTDTHEFGNFFTDEVGETIADYEDKFRSVDQDILSGVMAAVGLVFAFYGEALFNIVIFGVGFVLSSQGCYYLLKYFDDTIKLTNNVILYISLGVGVVGGALLVWLRKLAVFVVGAVGGALLANFLYGLTAWKTQNHEQWIQYTVLGVGGLLGGLIMHKMVKQLLRAATALVGGFFVAASVGYYINRFGHDETAATGAVESSWIDIAEYFGRPDEVFSKECSDACIACFVTWAVIFVFGSLYQYRKLPCCKKCNQKKSNKPSGSAENANETTPLLNKAQMGVQL